MTAEQKFVRFSELARLLGWPRTLVYYWASRLEIPVTVIQGMKFVKDDDQLPRILLAMQSAREESDRQRRERATARKG